MPGDPPCWMHLLFEDEGGDRDQNPDSTPMTASVPQDLDRYLAEHDRRIHDELYEFLRIPSVSARSEHKPDMQRAAEFLRDDMRRIGLEATIHQTAGHPVVVGEWRKAPGAPTILVYGHYDVQPPEPIDEWVSPPFEPTLRDGNIYCRGSVDDKGQLFLHLKGLEAHLKTRGTLPVNVVVLAEGEEEVGSENLDVFIEAHREHLKCDGVVVSDSAMFAAGMPTILSSLRGLAYFEINVRGAEHDLHSGSYGGAVPNPAQALARVVASFHDETGRIAIPGFYDRVREWPAHVLEQMRALPFDEAEFRRAATAPELAAGERGYSVLERIWTRPTCEVNGLLSGYTGEGAKTVLPYKAMAKVSCRLVPDQSHQEIARLLDAHVQRVCPAGVTATVTYLHGGNPWRADLSGPLLEAGSRALQAAFGREPVITGEGGSIPVVDTFDRLLGAPVLLLGFGLPGENAHAPNEWLSDENFVKGMRCVAALWDEYAKSAKT